MTSTTVTDKPLENNALKSVSPKSEEKQSAAAQPKNETQTPPTSSPLAEQTEKLNQIGKERSESENSKSWGDRFKSLSFGAVTHVGVNYFINTFIAASFAYVFERNLADGWKRTIAKIVDRSKDYKNDRLALHQIQDNPAYKAVNYAASAVLLTAGGTLLLPFMKHAEENRQQYQYTLSKILDKTQSKLGMGNEDTQKNLDDYKRIEEIAAAKCYKKECGASPEEIERLEEKYHFSFQDNGAVKFDKVDISWWEMIKARGMAIAMSMTTGAILGASKGKTKVAQSLGELEAMEKSTAAEEARGYFGDKGFGILESKAVKPLANTLEKVPGFATHAETQAGSKKVDSLHFAKLLFMDAILTVVSSVTFAFASGKKKENEPDKKQLDTNKDGWVTLQEAEQFKSQHKEADITGVHIDNVIQGDRHHASKVTKQAPQTHTQKAVPSSHVEKVNAQRDATPEMTLAP